MPKQDGFVFNDERHREDEVEQAVRNEAENLERSPVAGAPGSDKDRGIEDDAQRDLMVSQVILRASEKSCARERRVQPTEARFRVNGHRSPQKTMRPPLTDPRRRHSELVTSLAGRARACQLRIPGVLQAPRVAELASLRRGAAHFFRTRVTTALGFFSWQARARPA